MPLTIEQQHAHQIPRLNNYFGVWAIRPREAAMLQAMVYSMDWSSHFAQYAAQDPDALAAGTAMSYGESSDRCYRTQVTADGSAVIDIEGTLTKHGGSLGFGTSTVKLRQAIRECRNDSSIRQIVLRIDSPGGTVAGTEELANEIKQADAVKPVIALIEDLGASAAYWIASQCREIYASSRTTNIGSIGTLLVAHDISKRAASDGVKVLVFSTGPHKGTGVPGSEITDEQQAKLQEHVDVTNEVFLSAVRSGRSLTDEQLSLVSDGSVFLAAAAQRNGLIDGIKSLESLLENTNPEPSTTKPTARKENAMAAKQQRLKAKAEEEKKETEVMDEEEEEETSAMDDDETEEGTESAEYDEEEEEAGDDKPKSKAARPATYKELKAELVGADAEFLTSQLDAEATLAQARRAWISELNSRVQNSSGKIGNEPISHKRPIAPKGRPASSAKEALEIAIKAKMEETKLSRPEAARRLRAKRPDLFDAVVGE